ncbi:MAG TPA: hypothetical protein VKP11_04210 [Frankiaceae bacterium]|nr:hypothetical protein [Frankiaceae bacterium]
MPGVDHPPQRQREQARVQPAAGPVPAEVLGERAQLRVPRVGEHGVADPVGLRPPAGPVAGQPEPVGEPGAAVEGDLAQRRGVGERPAGGPHLPDPVVGRGPLGRGGGDEPGQPAPQARVDGAARGTHWWAQSRISPYTSCWRWSAAALPQRTGAEPR